MSDHDCSHVEQWFAKRRCLNGIAVQWQFSYTAQAQQGIDITAAYRRGWCGFTHALAKLLAETALLHVTCDVIATLNTLIDAAVSSIGFLSAKQFCTRYWPL
eukprot:GHRR01024590.1.p3 GENE.GHRR01024590.1~~GHRR01024590.1.p3  ORF type:complete len:102 (-),score=29.51 GHRR01024590.1:691-996(-)